MHQGGVRRGVKQDKIGFPDIRLFSRSRSFFLATLCPPSIRQRERGRVFLLRRRRASSRSFAFASNTTLFVDRQRRYDGFLDSSESYMPYTIQYNPSFCILKSMDR